MKSKLEKLGFYDHVTSHYVIIGLTVNKMECFFVVQQFAS